MRAATPRRSVAIRRGPRFGPSTRSTCCGWPMPPVRPRNHCRSPSEGSASISPTRAVCPSAWSRACTSCPSSPISSRTSSTSGTQLNRTNATQRPPRVAAGVQRLGHVVLQTTRYTEALNFYLDNLGMIVSDFLFYPGQRARGPVMSFIRCDRGSDPYRPPHPRARVGTGQPLCALRLPGVRPRCARRRR